MDFDADAHGVGNGRGKREKCDDRAALQMMYDDEKKEDRVLTSGICKSKSGVRGTLWIPTLFTFAQALYIPYFGGVIIMASPPRAM